MYLEKNTYVQQWDHQDADKKFFVSVLRGGKPYPHIHLDRIHYIVEGVAQWRKANQIHAWFVTHCADGVDTNGGRHYVSLSQLKELVETCKEVIAASRLVDGKIVNGKIIVDSTMARDLLPSESGFFFGSTEYDQYYLEDLHSTVEMLTPLIEEQAGESADYYYHSSW